MRVNTGRYSFDVWLPVALLWLTVWFLLMFLIVWPLKLMWLAGVWVASRIESSRQR